jgi:hypothetical protein
VIRHDAKRYLYGAHAIALSGEITRPTFRVLSPSLSVALPVTGGHQHQQAEGMQMDGIVSSGAASVQVTGGAREDGYTTLATATVEKLNILNVVTADRLVARLASRYSYETDEASVYLVGSYFENLRIAGSYVGFRNDDELMSEAPTFEMLREAARGRRGPFEESNGTIYTSLVREIQGIPGSRIEGCRVDVPEFGSIYLGEVFASPQSRRLAMVRVELGCAIEGSFIAGELAGHWSSVNLAGDNPTRPKG